MESGKEGAEHRRDVAGKWPKAAKQVAKGQNTSKGGKKGWEREGSVNAV